VAQDRQKWRALANSVMNVQVSKKCGELLD
jgi:hypothetical protein